MGKRYRHKKLFLSILEEIPIVGELFENTFKLNKHGSKGLGKMVSCYCLLPSLILPVSAVAAIAILARDAFGVFQGSEQVREFIEGAKHFIAPLNPLDEIGSWLRDIGGWISGLSYLLER